jgi:hypothetical protein
LVYFQIEYDAVRHEDSEKIQKEYEFIRSRDVRALKTKVEEYKKMSFADF